MQVDRCLGGAQMPVYLLERRRSARVSSAAAISTLTACWSRACGNSLTNRRAVRALGSYVGVASNATWMRQIVLTEFPLAETGAVMRPGSDQRSHFTTESANQTAAEAISIMLAFRPYRCLSQQSAPNGGKPSRSFKHVQVVCPPTQSQGWCPTSVRPAPSR